MAERSLAGKLVILYRGNNDVGQHVESVAISAGGTGYSNSFAVTFTGGGGTGASGTATAASGIITSVEITNGGTGYTSNPTPVFTAGGGTGGTGTAARNTVQTFDAVVCLKSNNITQDSNVISADTKCGTLKLAGTKNQTVDFDYISRLEVEDGHVSLEGVQADYESGDEVDWKITTAEQATGDPIFNFSGYVSTHNITTDTADFLAGNATIQVDENGIDLTAAA